MAQVFEVPLKREENNQPWGFRLRGGSDQGLPLHIEHIQPNGRAARAGLQAGDLVIAICRTPVGTKTHQQVKSDMLRAGNDLDLTIQRESGGVPTQQVTRPADCVMRAEPRSQVVEEPTAKMGGPTFKQITPKTYKVLEDELPQCATDAPVQAANPTPEPSPVQHPQRAAVDSQGGARPASIFDRKKQERSGYLQSQGSSIQKAYGEKS